MIFSRFSSTWKGTKYNLLTENVADGYARNYLLPKKLVIAASEVGKKIIEHQARLIKLKKEKRKKVNEKILEGISGTELKIAAQVGEEGKLFGSVTTMDIARKLKETGFDIDKRKIQLDNPIKQVGEYEISLKLDEGLVAAIKVIVDKE